MAGIGKKVIKIECYKKSINGIDVTFTWNQAPTNSSYPRYTWDEVELLQHAAGDLANEPWQKWEEDKKKKLIKLILRFQGKTIEEEKEIKNFKIKVDDVKLLAEKVLGIEVITENIKF